MGDKVVRFENWNDELRRGLVNFATSHPADRTTLGGSIWFDFMHPTSRVHNILAGEIAQFLASQPPPSLSLQRYLFSFLAFLTRHKSKREKAEKSTYKTTT